MPVYKANVGKFDLCTSLMTGRPIELPDMLTGNAVPNAVVDAIIQAGDHRNRPSTFLVQYRLQYGDPPRLSRDCFNVDIETVD